MEKIFPAKQLGFGWLILIVGIWGCAQQATIRMMKPAEIDISGIRRIAIFDFRGPENSGQIAASVFTSKLWETNFYTLLERSELQKILEEQALSQSGIVDMETALEVGSLLGLDAVIVGELISYDCRDDLKTRKVNKQVWTGEYERDKDGNVVYEKTLFGKVKKKKYREVLFDEEITERDATVGLAFRLVDVKTGQIRAARQTSHSFKKTAVSGEETLPPRQEILNQLLEEGVADFVRMLAPYFVTVKAQFAKGDDKVNRGIEFAKNDLWDKAQMQWQNVVSQNASNHAAWYNLGLAYEAQGQYGEAEAALDKAVSIESKKMYMEALKRVRQEHQDFLKLQKQLQQQEKEDI